MNEITDKNILEKILGLCKTRNELMLTLIDKQQQKNKCIDIINAKEFCFGPVWCFTWRIALIVILILSSVYIWNNQSNLFGETSTILAPMINSVAFTIIIVLVIWTVVKAILTIFHYKNIHKAKKKIKILDEHIKSYFKQIESMTKQVLEYNYLPEAYIFAGDIIITYILNRRADCLKEAINIFENERRSNIQFHQQMQALQQISIQLRKNRHSNLAGIALLSSATFLSGFSK